MLKFFLFLIIFFKICFNFYFIFLFLTCLFADFLPVIYINNSNLTKINHTPATPGPKNQQLQQLKTHPKHKNYIRIIKTASGS